MFDRHSVIPQPTYSYCGNGRQPANKQPSNDNLHNHTLTFCACVSLPREAVPLFVESLEEFPNSGHAYGRGLQSGERKRCLRARVCVIMYLGVARSQQPFRGHMSLCARSEIHVCLRRESAAVLSREHVPLCVLSASERSSFLSHDCVSFFMWVEIQVRAWRENKTTVFLLKRVSLRSDCDPSVCPRCENAALFCIAMSLCARREVQVCSRKNTAVSPRRSNVWE